MKRPRNGRLPAFKFCRCCEKKCCVSRGAAERALRAKRTGYTLNPIEIVQPGGSWAEQKQKNAWYQATIRDPTEGRLKTA